MVKTIKYQLSLYYQSKTSFSFSNFFNISAIFVTRFHNRLVTMYETLALEQCYDEHSSSSSNSSRRVLSSLTGANDDNVFISSTYLTTRSSLER